MAVQNVTCENYDLKIKKIMKHLANLSSNLEHKKTPQERFSCRYHRPTTNKLIIVQAFTALQASMVWVNSYLPITRYMIKSGTIEFSIVPDQIQQGYQGKFILICCPSWLQQ